MKSRNFILIITEKSGPYLLVMQSDINKTTKFKKLNKLYLKKFLTDSALQNYSIIQPNTPNHFQIFYNSFTIIVISLLYIFP